MEYRVEGRTPVGRPKRTWLESVEVDMAELEIDKDRHHQLDPPFRLLNRSVMTARSPSYSSTLTRSITFSKQPSSPESLSDPHLEELSIKAELGNTKWIISNVYIPPASSCSNGYQSSIEHLLTTQDTLILGDISAHSTLDRPIQEEEKWQTQSTDLTMVFWYSPTRVPPNAEPSSPDVSLLSSSLITSCSWQTLSTLSSDHLPILIRLQIKTSSNPGLHGTYVNLKKANWDRYRQEV